MCFELLLKTGRDKKENKDGIFINNQLSESCIFRKKGNTCPKLIKFPLPLKEADGNLIRWEKEFGLLKQLKTG
jgi:hypothetical protein